MVLAGDETLAEWLHRKLDEGTIRRLHEIATAAGRLYGEPLRAVISRERMASVERLVARVLVESPPREMPAAHWLERMTMHPIWGVPVLLGVLWLAYEFVGVFGAGTAVNFIEDNIFNGYVNPAAVWFFETLVPIAIVRDFFIGDYGIITMARAWR
jgi:ferrous iron transport protein B